ncbi:SpoIIE family protein phosphatase [candidate division KSB1 bacterium]|nr:SpoIIE family protein phosphatase [candidate division KSB1 bacterium]
MILEQLQQVDDLQLLVDRMDFLHSVSQKISQKKALPLLLQEIMEESKNVLNAEASSLLLYNVEQQKLSFQVATGEKGKIIEKYSIPLGTGLAGWVAEHRMPLNIEDCYRDARFDPRFDKMSHFITKSLMCVPLMREDKLIGVMQVINKRDGESFDDIDMHIFETLASQCAIAIENAQLVEQQLETEVLKIELETARAIQQNLLPKALPEYEDISIGAKLVAADQVGGDYFNILRLNERESLFLIADVSGKGIPAALIVSTIHSCLQTFLHLNQEHFDLMGFVHNLNSVLIESTTSDKFATCWFGLYDHHSKVMTSVNCGHNPPFLFRQGEQNVIALEAGGIFLGSIKVPIGHELIPMQSNDVLLIYTDGVTEAWNRKQVMYGEKRMQNVIRKNTLKSPADIVVALFDDIYHYIGPTKQSDDITCLIIKFQR